MNLLAPATRPNKISDWKKLFMEQASQVFDRATHLVTAVETDLAPLHEQIGRLQMELSFLKKIGSMSLTQRRAFADPVHPASIRQHCQWFSLPRSSY